MCCHGEGHYWPHDFHKFLHEDIALITNGASFLCCGGFEGEKGYIEDFKFFEQLFCGTKVQARSKVLDANFILCNNSLIIVQHA